MAIVTIGPSFGQYIMSRTIILADYLWPCKIIHNYIQRFTTTYIHQQICVNWQCEQNGTWPCSLCLGVRVQGIKTITSQNFFFHVSGCFTLVGRTVTKTQTVAHLSDSWSCGKTLYFIYTGKSWQWIITNKFKRLSLQESTESLKVIWHNHGCDCLTQMPSSVLTSLTFPTLWHIREQF